MKSFKGIIMIIMVTMRLSWRLHDNHGDNEVIQEYYHDNHSDNEGYHHDNNGDDEVILEVACS